MHPIAGKITSSLNLTGVLVFKFDWRVEYLEPLFTLPGHFHLSPASYYISVL